MDILLKIFGIIIIIISAHYLNKKVAFGDDKKLIFVRLMSIILGILVISMIIGKIISPDVVENSDSVFELIKSIMFIIVGYLFGNKNNNKNNNKS